MPEGDTIHLTATRLASMLEGARVQSCRAKPEVGDVDPWIGCRVETVEARGKHLLILFSDGRYLHSHMGMNGSWHRYRQRETWRKPEAQADFIMHVEARSLEPSTPFSVAICFTPAVLEVLTAPALRRHRRLSVLGPDLLSPNYEFSAVLPRLRANDHRSIAECLLDQTIACGIGNIYKSESLFVAKIHPETPVEDLADATLESLYDRARRLMRVNLEGYIRRTRPHQGGSKLWVYQRSGAACLRCGTRISRQRQGDLARSTYWCPSCQSRTDSAST